MTDPREGGRGSHLLAWCLLAATGLVLLASSFKAWGDPIIDLGRDLYLPSQILQGRVLYRDLLYNYGPVAPYLLVGAVALLGDALWVFELFGILIGVATLGGAYAIGARLGGAWVGFGAALLFLVLSFFAASTWGCNFVLPYSFAATVGTALAIWSFYFLLRYLYDGRSSVFLAWSVAFLLAAVLTKAEVGFGIAATHALAWWAHKVPRRAVLLILGSGSLLGVLFFAGFAARGPGEHALFGENLAKFAGGGESARFFQLVAGLDRPAPHLLRSLKSAAQVGLILAVASFAAMAPQLVKRRRLAVALAAAALATCAGLIWWWAGVRLFQAVPLLALGVVGYFLVRERRDPLFLLGAFVLLSAPRVLLQYHPMWYGFYLAVPAYPFVVYTLGVRAAEWTRGGRTARVAMAALALLIMVRFEAAMWQSYRHKTSVLVTGKGTLRDEPGGRTQAIAEFLEYAQTRLAAEEPKMVVMPEGVSLNYFTGFPNPTAYYLFTPPEIRSPGVERKIIRELEATKPELLLLTSRDLTEYRRRGIGLDYALELGDWIRRSYELERIFEAGEEQPWRLVLLRYRDRDSPRELK